MATIKGQNLRIMAALPNETTRCIAAATSCVCHLALVTQEDNTKDTDDDWIRTEPVGLNWDVQVEALVVDANDEYYREGAIAADELQVGREYDLEFIRTLGAAGEKNRDVSAQGHHYNGRAILSDIQFTSPNGDLSVARAQFTGVGSINDEYNPGT